MFKMNGTDFETIEIGNWEYRPHQLSLSLQQNFNALKTHIWTTRIMTVADYHVIDNLRGQLISLETIDHEDRSQFREYPNAKIDLIRGRQSATNMIDVEIRMRVL